ncbi:CASP-like protein 4D1 [Humulus lupulus]|uniref:CASP-like protein 4D1 n=1 Tax=Humulus lupulus TaxID=3486 RepID=UPI002B404DB2|nr:CASP-like protein 4D1 [Humulus lupulus]
MASNNKSTTIHVAPFILALRILTLLLFVGSIAVLLLDTYKLSDGEKTTFKDINAYRYVVATAAIGAVYLILQLPFAIYYGCTEKRLIPGKVLAEVDFYGDKVVSLFVASGVGAGFAVSFELKDFVPGAFDLLILVAQSASGGGGGGALDDDYTRLLQEERDKIPGFLDKGYIASGILLAGCVFMIFVSVLSSINRTNT